VVLDAVVRICSGVVCVWLRGEYDECEHTCDERKYTGDECEHSGKYSQ
jgi:hypothetical protein